MTWWQEQERFLEPQKSDAPELWIPLASGLLVLLVGQATKLSQYILDANKAYKVGLHFGYTTDTLDTTGVRTSSSDMKPQLEEVIEAGSGLSGDFQWSVPAYSAVKISGEKLYEKARRGETVVTPTKTMKFWDVKFSGVQEGEYFLKSNVAKAVISGPGFLSLENNSDVERQ